MGEVDRKRDHLLAGLYGWQLHVYVYDCICSDFSRVSCLRIVSRRVTRDRCADVCVRLVRIMAACACVRDGDRCY